MSEAVVIADQLKQVYPISRGPLRAPAQLQAVSGVSFTLQAGRTRSEERRVGKEC